MELHRSGRTNEKVGISVRSATGPRVASRQNLAMKKGPGGELPNEKVGNTRQ